MDNLSKAIGSRIRAGREGLGWNQSDLAKELGITASSVNQYEAGVKRPSTEVLLRLAQLFGVTTDFLYGVSDERKCLWDSDTGAMVEEYQSLRRRDRQLVREVIRAFKRIGG